MDNDPRAPKVKQFFTPQVSINMRRFSGSRHGNLQKKSIRNYAHGRRGEALVARIMERTRAAILLRPARRNTL
jgi:hypothetical protein